MLELNKIYCGDCLDFMGQMEDKSVDLVLTDPPYGIGEHGGKSESRCRSTGVTPSNYPNLNWDTKPPTLHYFNEMFRISKNQIIFGGNYFSLPPSPCWIVWDKVNGENDFADCELAWTSFSTAVRKYRYKWHGMLQENMAHKEIRIHPTQKPVKLFEWIIKNYAQEGDVICDPFFGSGSSLVACIKTGHPYIGFEKERLYFDGAQKRINALPNTKLEQWF